MFIMSEKLWTGVLNLATNDSRANEAFVVDLDYILQKSIFSPPPMFSKQKEQKQIRDFIKLIQDGEPLDRMSLEDDLITGLYAHIEEDLTAFVSPYLPAELQDAMRSPENFVKKDSSDWLINILSRYLLPYESRTWPTKEAVDALFYRAAESYDNHMGRTPTAGPDSNFYLIMRLVIEHDSIKENVEIGTVRKRCQKAINQLDDASKTNKPHPLSLAHLL